MHNNRLTYRPEIDGLRAVAVLSVFIFHLNANWLPGGFVGVDIFFVISGYLITSILYNDCEEGRFSLARFYQRRIARIFPAFFTVALATLAGAALVYSPQDLASAGANLVAALLSVANVKYMLQGSYFQISPDAQPFLHYWSLSVEEQFYIIFPILLFLIFRYARAYLVPILALLTIGSLAACVVLTQVNPVWAFYLLPTRAWELGAGALLAAFLSTSSQQAVPNPRLLPFAGLLVIGGSIIFVQEGSQFPGWQAIFPVVGTVAIIASGAGSNSRVEQWLSSRPMVNIGKMSYSLYLWHWPVFSLIDYQFYALPVEIRLGLKIGLSALLTVATFRLIEVPARAFLNQPRRLRLSFATMVGLAALCIPLGVTIRHNNYVNAELADVAKGGLTFPGKPGAPTLVLMGDSNGSMYGKVVKEISADSQLNLSVISVAAGDPLPSLKGEASQLWFESLEMLKKTNPDYLLLANHWASKLQDDPARLAAALDQIKPHVRHIILLNQPPILPKDANRSYVREHGHQRFFEDPESRAQRLKVNELLLSFQSPRVSIIDVSKHFEAEDGAIRFVDEKGRGLYHDATHLSGYGADRIRGALSEMINSKLGQ